MEQVKQRVDINVVYKRIHSAVWHAEMKRLLDLKREKLDAERLAKIETKATIERWEAILTALGWELET